MYVVEDGREVSGITLGKWAIRNIVQRRGAEQIADGDFKLTNMRVVVINPEEEEIVKKGRKSDGI